MIAVEYWFDIISVPDPRRLYVLVLDFEPSEMRVIQEKEPETGFFTVDELVRLDKTGFRRPSEVPPKPQPKDRSILTGSARQRIFQGEPRFNMSCEFCQDRCGEWIQATVLRKRRIIFKPCSHCQKTTRRET